MARGILSTDELYKNLIRNEITKFLRNVAFGILRIGEKYNIQLIFKRVVVNESS